MRKNLRYEKISDTKKFDIGKKYVYEKISDTKTFYMQKIHMQRKIPKNKQSETKKYTETFCISKNF